MYDVPPACPGEGQQSAANAERMYRSGSLWNFITVTFSGAENEDLPRPVLADGLIREGERWWWPVCRLHALLQYGAAEPLTVTRDAVMGVYVLGVQPNPPSCLRLMQ